MAPINGNDNGDNKTVGAEKPTGTAMNGTRNTASNKSIASGHANAQSPPSRATGANATLPRKPRAKKAPPTEHTKATVFVRKLPKDTTDAELEAFFGEVGPLKSCFVVRKRGEREEAGDGGDGAAEEAMTSKGSYRAYVWICPIVIV